MATIEKQGDMWHERFTCRGVAHHKALSKNEAQAWTMLREAVALAKAGAKAGGLVLAKWEAFKAAYFSRSIKAAETLRIEGYAMKRLEGFFPLSDVEDLTPELVESFRISQKKAGHGIKGVRRNTRALRSVGKWAVKNGMATPKNWDMVNLDKVTEVPIVPYIVGEVEKLLKFAAKHIQHLALAMLTTRAGLRCSEAYWLRKVDCDMKLRRINIVPQPGFTPKSNKARFVPMADDLYVFLKWLFPRIPGEWVIADYNGWRPASAFAMAAEFRRQVTGPAKLRGRLHILRHTFATHYMQGNKKAASALKDLADILGHTSIQTTQRYVHLASSRLDATMTNMPKIKPLVLPRGQISY